jgi:hypothetical protein
VLGRNCSRHTGGEAFNFSRTARSDAASTTVERNRFGARCDTVARASRNADAALRTCSGRHMAGRSELSSEQRHNSVQRILSVSSPGAIHREGVSIACKASNAARSGSTLILDSAAADSSRAPAVRLAWSPRSTGAPAIIAATPNATEQDRPLAELACCSALLVSPPLLGVSELSRRLELTLALRLALGRFPLRSLSSCGQEWAFDPAELGGVLTGPLKRLLQAHATIHESRVAAEPLPLLRRRAELAKLQALAVLVEPLTEGRPLADQRFVCDLRRCSCSVARRASASTCSTVRMARSSSDRAPVRRLPPAGGYPACPRPTRSARRKMRRAIGCRACVKP